MAESPMSSFKIEDIKSVIEFFQNLSAYLNKKERTINNRSGDYKWSQKIIKGCYTGNIREIK
jgi:hypothetical protein